MAKIISPRREKAKQIEKVYWPETTVPYGEDTAFQAARVYAGAITGWQEIFKKKNALLRRAAELIHDAWQSGLAPGNEPENAGYYGSARTAALKMRNDWLQKRDQWLRDAGMEK